MSLAINIDDVWEVLLPDGEWHEVLPLTGEDRRSSFDLDAYEYIERLDETGATWRDRNAIRLSGGIEPTIPATGATWLEKAGRVSCPLTSVLAVRHGKLRPQPAGAALKGDA